MKRDNTGHLDFAQCPVLSTCYMGAGMRSLFLRKLILM
jgi:hypothetical protein